MFLILIGPAEVKVFVDMMSIAAGESDIELAEVACFDASCQAFGPMIFELDQQAGFVELNAICLEVMKSVEKDPNLINKLVSQRH